MIQFSSCHVRLRFPVADDHPKYNVRTAAPSKLPNMKKGGFTLEFGDKELEIAGVSTPEPTYEIIS
jgi:hypothetical protein